MGNLISPSFQIVSSSFHYEHGSNKAIDDFLKNVRKIMSIEEFLSEFRKTKDYAEQISLVKLFFHWNQPGVEFKRFFEKRDEISLKYSDILRSSCQEGSFEEAEQEANLSISFAGSTNSLAVAYASRSILLYYLEDTRGALNQINLALSTLDDPEKGENEKRTKWQYFRDKYEEELGKELSLGEKDEKKNGISEKMKRQSFCKEFFRIHRPNSKAPALDEFVELRCNPRRGRHLVATQDIPIGKTLLVEKAFVCGLSETLELEQSHCHHCLKKNLQCIPCPNCVFALFCDRECMKAAIPYHQYECPCLPDLRAVLTDQKYFDGDNFYLAFKLICTLGPSKLFRMFYETLSCTSSTHTHLSNQVILGCDPVTGIFDPSSYLPIHHLAAEFTPEKNLFHLPLFSLILARILDINTTFFLHIDPQYKSKFLEFTAQKILHHYAGIRINVFSIWELSGPLASHGVTIQQSQQDKLEHELNLFARGIFPTASLVNHSCDPNVVLIPDLSPDTIAIITVKPLIAGEELTIFYCPPYPAEPRESRLERLLVGYDFNCTCLACRDKWPTMSEGLSRREIQFCCRNCSSKLFGDERSQKRMSKIVLNKENGFKCPACLEQYSEGEILEEFEGHKEKLNESFQLVQGNEPLEALETLARAMKFFERNIVPPYDYAMMVQKFYIEAIQFIIHFSK